MKTIKIGILLCLFISISTICQAQWQTTTNGIYYNSGNVGIGKTSPQYTLDVGGTMKINDILTTKIVAYVNQETTYDGKILAHYALNWVDDSWYPTAPTLWQSAWGGMKLFTGGTPRLVILNNGNVGIGYTNPGVKLDVAGVVRAHEVKVCLNQGCDYVFDDDYGLMNLNDLSDFIKTNKHLPDVAPATQMEEEGINLSEMNALLLKKVEELTLYILQQEERIKALEEAQ